MLIKYSGKYGKIYFNMKITFSFIPRNMCPVQSGVGRPTNME